MCRSTRSVFGGGREERYDGSEEEVGDDERDVRTSADNENEMARKEEEESLQSWARVRVPPAQRVVEEPKLFSVEAAVNYAVAVLAVVVVVRVFVATTQATAAVLALSLQFGLVAGIIILAFLYADFG